MSILINIDDKLVPLYRKMWVSATPHFCGEDDCTREGSYEIRLEQGESVWANPPERDKIIKQLEQWQGGLGSLDSDDGSW